MAAPRAFPTDGTWPLPIWDGRDPELSNPFGGDHRGIDTAYKATSTDPPYQGHYTANRTKLYFSPDDMPALAVAEGTVWSVGEDKHGKWVRLSHDGGKWNTYYRHLSSVNVAKGDSVAEGQQLGIIGADPSEGARGFKHVHLELEDWRSGKGVKVDPGDYMRNWRVSSPTGIVVRERWSDGRNTAPRAPADKGNTPGGGLLWLILLAMMAKRS